MTTRAAERVDEWESRPFTDGYEQLRTLADRSFSGAVTTGRATLYMIEGAVVDVLDGAIADFEDATGTIREAPTPALPLLAVMQERGDEVRAKYYSEETALREADGKLSEGGFTGYVELSENVLSGDYYVVYQAGKSMSVAFLGESGQLASGDEAFERADDEVGIYEVRPVDIDPVEIPDPPAAELDGPAENDEDQPAENNEDQPADESVETEPSPADSTDSGDSVPRGDDGAESGTGDRTRRDEHPADASDSTSGVAESPSSETVEGGSPSDTTESGSPSDTTESGSLSDTTESDSLSDTTESGSPSDTAESDSPSESPDRSSSGTPDGRDHEPRAESAPRARDGRQRESGHDGRQREPEYDDRQRDASGTESEPRQERPTRERRREDDPKSTRDTQSRQSVPAEAQSAPDTRSQGGEPGTEHVDDSVRGSDATDGSESPALERRTIPSVDPDRTWTPDDETAGGSQGEQPTETSRRATPVQREPEHGERPDRRHAESGGQIDRRRAESGGTSDRQPAESGGRADRQRAESSDPGSEIADLEKRIEELEASRSELRTERDELQAQLRQVSQERDDLQEEVRRLREEVADLEDRLEAAAEPSSHDTTSTHQSTTGPSLTPREAIAGTNLFVRYGSKSDATLSGAHDGKVDAAAVDANLSLEHHTEFDDSEATVEGKPFESFLRETIHYRFVEWLVGELLYEIRDTGHRKALEDLYDAIPKIDRVQLAGTVTVDGDEETSREESFDVVVRDRMGNPLVVTNLDDSRTATTEEMMTELVTAATRAGEAHDRLAGAFFVTSSFFEPDALETAAGATGGGILSRDKRESFVRLSRKDGFHLCLVESRDGGFHLSVPEL
ncbi:DUF7527 domain-containing protein [Halapricum desulfuricans]|uniref:DUF7527 domain-containing protein n=1 Tax=Halapricum desulfuricans TaxID=2841257 RepID=A0A897MXQ4_9EURY|nr:hypothetical protein [Halapricum desulfuricans]QSG05244.1 Uncharacterized protein HSR121_0894 [Halapricum desulfuricans]